MPLWTVVRVTGNGHVCKWMMLDRSNWLCRHPSYFVGLLLKEASLPYSNYGHVVLAKPSPILFYPISSIEVVYCVGTRDRMLTHYFLCLGPNSQIAGLFHFYLYCTSLLALQLVDTPDWRLSSQVRCLVDVPGEKLPSQVSGALSEYLTSHVADEVRWLS